MATQGLEQLEKLTVTKIQKRIEEIGRYVWTDHADLEIEMAETMEHLGLEEARRLSYRPVRPGRLWGKAWGTAWFRLRGAVPESHAGEPVGLLFWPEGECIIFRDGEPVQALDHNHRDYRLFDRARGGEAVELHVEAGANNPFGSFERRRLGEARLAVFNEEVWQAWQSLSCLADMLPTAWTDWWGTTHRVADPQETRRARILFGLNKAVDLFDYRQTDRAALRRSARRVLKALEPLLAPPANASAQTVAALGHAHIDVAWLWPLAETVRKCGRTFSNVLALMERYPEFVFCQSQPHLYEFARERYPTLYREIKKRVKTGQWVPTGAAWVEMDCNVTGGESLIRQLLFGSRFFREEFDHEACCLWLPDVFGYSAALPQILRRSGIDYFLTQKISWSQFTTFPYHSFHWEGIDGTRVLTHFPPADTYNGMLTATEVRTAARNYRQKDRSPIQALPYGYGDGGGGPNAAHLERLRRYHDLEGMPRVQPMTPREFFRRLESDSEELPRWVGELYLELHRGTLTTQARNKRENRKAEILLREAEMLGALALPLGEAYPRETLNQAWKTVLLNQFHDIIPGSSIDKVYEDTDRHYAEVRAAASEARDRSLAGLAAAVETRGEGQAVLVFNALSWPRTALAEVAPCGLRKGAAYLAAGPDGTQVPVQVGPDGTARFLAGVPALGHAVYHLRPGRAEAPALTADERVLESDRLRVRLDRRGRVTSIYDKANGREAVAPGETANQLLLFEDKPVNWDAWDVDIFYNDKLLEADGELLGVEVVEAGPVRAALRVRRRISRSTVTQEIVLVAGSPRVEFQTVVDWEDEKDVFLKAAFPVDVRSESARYEIQFGSLERPTHWNTPQDFARFEVCGHKWADLAEGDYGVALLNDCKYGHDVRDNVMRLSLLRAPKHPDPTADIGREHRFTYALQPHAGDFRGGVVRAGYDLNMPLTAVAVPSAAGELPPAAERLACESENVVIETVKKAEDDDGIIVRLYEAHGARGRHSLQTDLPVRRAVETDLMEREEKEFSVSNGRLRFTLTPFQIRTFKLEL